MNCRNIPFILLIGALLLTVLITAGCVSTAPANIEGDWVQPGEGITISFSKDGTYSGQAPVNSYFGSYKLDRNTILLENQGSTKMAGSVEDMQKEDTYFATLKEVTAFSTPGNKLEFYNNRGKTILTFEKAAAGTLIGTWKTDDGSTITFETDGTFSGHAPVNRYLGTYVADGKTLQLGSIVCTEMAGSVEDMEKETEYLEKLGEVRGFTLGSHLQLLDAEGNVVLEYQKG